MKVKLDENLVLEPSGCFWPVVTTSRPSTIRPWAARQTTDLYTVCVSEERTLVTLDLDFANPFRFDPVPTAGLVVLRVSEAPGIRELEAVVSRLLDAVGAREVSGRPWVVDWGRVREYRPPDPGTGE